MILHIPTEQLLSREDNPESYSTDEWHLVEQYRQLGQEQQMMLLEFATHPVWQ